MAKVLFLTQGDETMASTRFRVLAYLKKAPEELDYLVMPLPKGSRLDKIMFLIKTAIAVQKYDSVFIQKILLPSPILIYLKSFCRRLIYDFDDALFAEPPGKLFNASLLATKRGRLEKTLKAVDQIVCGNTCLRDFAYQFNNQCLVLPSPVDVDVYRPRNEANAKNNQVVIGWVGRAENLEYLNRLDGVFSKIEKDYGDRVRLEVVCDAPFQSRSQIALRNIPWTLEQEREKVAAFDVGIMPLEDTAWARGKCAFKLIQYMACGVPGVASPVGMNCDVVRHGENGFLANNENEWFECLAQLISNPEKRKQIAFTAREDIENSFSLAVLSDQFFGALLP